LLEQTKKSEVNECEELPTSRWYTTSPAMKLILKSKEGRDMRNE
jgi:hypothetical protein